MRGEQYPVAGMKLPVGILRQPLKKAIDTFVTGRSIREIGVETSCLYRHMSTAPRHAVPSARAVARPATSTTNARIAVSLIPRIP